MGGTQSVQGDGTLKLAIANVRRRELAVGGGDDVANGGSPGYFGGDSAADATKELREYELSLSAQAKEDVIRRLARALKTAGIEKIDPEGDLDAIVATMVDQIPNPKRGKGYPNVPEKQSEICRVIARVLNDQFTPGATKASEKLIDTSLDEAAICSQVSQVAHSFAAGVNTEYLGVIASVRNALKNLQLLDEILMDAHRTLMQKVADSDKKTARELEPIQEIYTRAQSERKLQEILLQNVLNIELAPAAKQLEIALRDESEQNAIIKKLGLRLGTKEFGHALSMSIVGLGTAASVAQRVNKALKTVGVSIKQYLDSPDYKAFQHLLDQKIESGGVKPEDLTKFLAAANSLRESFSLREEKSFREALEEKSGGAPSANTVTAAPTAAGGADESPAAKQIERREAEKKVIVKDFAQRLSRHYRELLQSIQLMGPELGGKIPLTASTERLRDALERLNTLRSSSERIELSLIGFYLDADARARKEQFTSALRHISSICAEIMGLQAYRDSSSYFARLKEAITSIEKTIDFFSDVVTKKYGASEASDGGVSSEVVTGGADDDLLPELATSALSLKEAVRSFKYFYYISGFRQSLNNASKDLEAYGKGYEDMLGDAVATRLSQLEEERKAAVNRMNGTTNPAAATAAADRVLNARGVAVSQEARTAVYAEFVAQVNLEYSVKSRFYKVVQAMDLYMKEFSAGIAKDPDAARGIRKMLEGTDLIARWYNEVTGDSLWKAFESMGRAVGGAVVQPTAADVGSVAAASGTKDHYYQKLSAAATAGGVAIYREVGIPVLGVEIGAAVKNCGDYIEESLNFFQALKNLMNAFARMGESFGGQELRAKIFLSPTQMYKSMMDYLKHSALSINTGDPITAAVAGLNLPGDSVVTGQVYMGSISATPAAAPAAGHSATIGGNFVVEDRYFYLLIKAMASKILVVLNMYELLDHDMPLADLVPVRMIVGGAEAAPEIIAEAAELYFRLPRLAEFYRFLRWDGTGAQELKIAMLPEFEGVFAGLIRVVFRSTSVEGNYTDSEMRTIISEVNNIYRHYSGKSDSQRAIAESLNGLVSEVNRRYGVLKRKDVTAATKLEFMERKGVTAIDRNNTRYAILPGEEENEIERRAPSDRYASIGSSQTDAVGRILNPATGRPYDAPYARSDNKLDTEWNADGAREMLRSFRQSVEDEFAKVPRNRFGDTSYSLAIKQATNDITRATSADAKLAAAFKLIQTANLVNTDTNNAYLFHETVAVGVDVLNGMYTMLANFRRTTANLDPVMIEGYLMDRFHAGATLRAPAAGVDGMSTQVGIMTDLLQGVAPDDQKDMIISWRQSFVPVNNEYAAMTAARMGVPDLTAAGLQRFILDELAHVRANPLPNGLLPSQVQGDLPAVGAAAGAVAWTAVQIRTLRSLRIISRFIIDYNALMRVYIDQLFALADSSQGLIEVRVAATGNVQLNFAKLRSSLEELMDDTKNLVESFRSLIDSATIERFEGKTTDDFGTLRWLEKNLIDGFLRGSFSASEADRKLDESKSLDGVANLAVKVFKNLTRKTDVSLVGYGITNANMLVGGQVEAAYVAAPAIMWTTAAEPGKSESFSRAISALIFYDSTVPSNFAANVDIATNTSVGSGYQLNTLIRFPRTGAAGAALVLPKTSAGADVRRIPIFTATPDDEDGYGLLFKFNQFIAQYLAMFTDMSSGGKIYTNLISGLANGALSTSVNAPAGRAWPDMRAGVAGREFNGDPLPTAILFQSLGFVMQRLRQDVLPNNQLSEHLLATLTDIPLYMKESYRANLPGFVELFTLLSRKCDFLRQFIQNGGLDLSRDDQFVLSGLVAAGANAPAVAANATNASVAGPQNARAYMPMDNFVANSVVSDPSASNVKGGLDSLKSEMKTAQMQALYYGLLDALSNASYAVIAAGGDVLRELGDNPVYFQTQEGAIENYRMRYGKQPLMPLSHLLWYFNGISEVNQLVYPQSEYGTAAFKMSYANRALITPSGAFSLERAPGIKSMVESYAATVTAGDRLDTAQLTSFTQRITAFVRYIVESRNFKSWLATGSTFTNYELVGGLLNSAIVNGANGNAVYAIGKTKEEILSSVEGPSVDEQLASLVRGISSVVQRSSRADERILNIIDMNVMPINFHALMQYMPLASLYNHEAAFEQMVASVFGEQATKFSKIPSTAAELAQQDAATKTTRHMFIRLLINPYLELSERMYGSDVKDFGSSGFVQRIFRGDNSLGMGRPKILSDQLFNKALFGSIYQAQDFYDEAGPAVGVGASRGHASRFAHSLPLGNVIGAITQPVGAAPAVIAPTAAEAAAVGNVAVGNLIAGATADSVSAAIQAGNLVRSVNYIDRVIRAIINQLPAAGAVIDRAVASSPPGPQRASLDALKNDVETKATEYGRLPRAANFAEGFVRDNNYRHSIDEVKNTITPAVDLMAQEIKTIAADPASAGSAVIAAAPAEVDRRIAAINVARTNLGNINPITTPNAARDVNAAMTAIHNEHDGLVTLYTNVQAVTPVGVGSGLAVPVPLGAYTALADPVIRANYAAASQRILSAFTSNDPTRGYLPAVAAVAAVTPDVAPYQVRPGGRGWVDSDEPSATKMTFLKTRAAGDPPESAIGSINITFADKQKLNAIGKSRFDTNLVRKLFFIVNVTRILRLKINRELAQDRGVLVSSFAAVNPGLTEYGFDPYTPNEVYDSRTNDVFDVDAAGNEDAARPRGLPRFDDE